MKQNKSFFMRANENIFLFLNNISIARLAIPTTIVLVQSYKIAHFASLRISSIHTIQVQDLVYAF